MKIRVLFLLLSFTTISYSQEYQKINCAEKLFNEGKYEKAIKKYKSVAYTDTMHAYIQYKIGKSLYETNRIQEAVPYFESAEPYMKDSMGYHFDMYHLYSSLGYDVLAKKSFIRYVHLCKTCVKKDLLPGSSSNKLIYKKPFRDAEVIGYETKYNEYFPYMLNDDEIVHFNVKRSPKLKANALDYQSYLTEEYAIKDFMFYHSREYTQINKPQGMNYGGLTMNDKKDKTYVTRWDNEEKRTRIFFSQRTNIDNELDWVRFRPVSIENDEGKYNFIHPMYSDDEKHLYFATDMPGGLGGYDIWRGEISSDLKVTNIKNLGTYVNTPGDEMYPGIYDDKVLFFSSNGHYGMGKLDLYAAVKSKKGRYIKTYNLGKGYNTEYDDYALFYNPKKKVSFFTSNRFISERTGEPKDRIYKIKENQAQLKIKVVNENGTSIPNAEVVYKGKKYMTTGTGIANIYTPAFSRKNIVVSAPKHSVSESILFPFESEKTITLQRKEPNDDVSFLMVDKFSDKPLINERFNLVSLNDGKIYSGVTDHKGYGKIKLYGSDDYKLLVNRYDYKLNKINFMNKAQTQKVYVITAQPKENVKKPILKREEKPVSVNEPLTLFFHTSQWIVQGHNKKHFDLIIDELKKDPNSKVEITAHTDCQGSSASNMALSKMRLKEVTKMIVSRGVNAKQIVGKPMGENQPYNDCKCDQYDNYNCDSDKFRKNRRAVLRLVK